MRSPAPTALLLTVSLAAGTIFAEGETGSKPPAFPPFQISVSYVANLIHWIDNLAGSSRGKTIGAYRRDWMERFGVPTPAEHNLLERWAGIRDKPERERALQPINGDGCLPQVEDPLPWRQIFLLRSYDAPSVEGFLEELSGRLDPGEIRDLEEIIGAFEPRFAKVWKSMGFLRRFEERFREYLDGSGLRPFLGEVARFLEVDPADHPPGRIHLMALPREGATFATAIGRDLMMEIPPGDGPREQVQVIAHETTHYLWAMIPPRRQDALARAVHAASPRGAVVWALLREGLPTAVGQGLAAARLVPGRFGMRYDWYHLRHIDRFAKEIYPLVEEAMRSGKTFAESVAPRAGRPPSGSPPPPHAPWEHLVEAVHLLGDGTLPAYTRVMQRAPTRHRWVFRAGDPAAGEMLERFQCLGGMAFVGPAEAADPSRLPGPVREALGLAPSAPRPGSAPGAEPDGEKVPEESGAPSDSSRSGEGSTVPRRETPAAEAGSSPAADRSPEGEEPTAGGADLPPGDPGPEGPPAGASPGSPGEPPGDPAGHDGHGRTLRSGIHALRRPAGGLLVVLVASRDEDVIPLADLYLGLRRVPDEPVPLTADSR